MPSLSMTKSQREAFLADTHVAIISIANGERAPLSVPVWYAYDPGQDIRLVTGGASRKATLLRCSGRLSLCVQTETAPYKYVSVEGPAVIAGEPDYERDVRAIARRYLGPEMGEMYLQLTANERIGSVLVRVRPKRWLTVDYTKMALPG